MFKFEWCWVFLLLPLPVLVRLFVPKWASKPRALKVPFFGQVYSTAFADSPSKFLLILATVTWLALVCATARPIWVEECIQLPISGRDLLIALDISGSMQQQDFSIGTASRLDVVQKIARDFVQRRAGDRVGLILFGSQPYLYAPLTFDLDTVADFLGDARVGFAGQQTAIGDTIGLAVKVLRAREAENRILILLTDGDNSTGSITPLQGMQLAVEHGVRIFIVGIGIDHSAVSSSGALRKPTNILPFIAEKTGGVYFHASDAQALEEIYTAIDQFEPIEDGTQSYLSVTELYPWPLAAALILTVLVLLQHRMVGLSGLMTAREELD